MRIEAETLRIIASAKMPRSRGTSISIAPSFGFIRKVMA